MDRIISLALLMVERCLLFKAKPSSPSVPTILGSVPPTSCASEPFKEEAHCISAQSNVASMTIGENSGDPDVAEEYYQVPVWKRTLDIACIILLSPVLLPVCACIALMIKCASPGAVLFLTERIGYRGCRFVCFKFRTMKTDADYADSQLDRRHREELILTNAPMVKMDAKGDPRLIPCGSILRATGMDELPQLLNVLHGQMSIVGPRPCMPYEYDRYLPAQKRRLHSLPGLTGLWQVSGKSKTTLSEMIALDIQYARTKTLWLDLTIILKTVPTLLAQVNQMRAQPEPKVEIVN
jgi:lipopolysaccharide/colanic/teichoic acid biosynthesis glycosyltransferase